MERYFQQIYFSEVSANVRKITDLHKNAYSSAINSRLIICISKERAWYPLQEKKAMVLKYIF